MEGHSEGGSCRGHSGTVTLKALRWLHDIGAAFLQIGADGEAIVASGPSGLDDARLRRAQALAASNGVGLAIVRVGTPSGRTRSARPRWR